MIRAPRRVSALPLYSTPSHRIKAFRVILEEHPGTSVPTQCKRLELALLGGPVCTQDAHHLGVIDIRARKRNLLKSGRNIATIWHRVEVETGAQHAVGVYVLARGQSTKPSAGGTPR